MEQIVLVGFGGHAKSVIDSIIAQGKYQIAGFTDMPECKDREYRGIKWLGTDDELKNIYAGGVKNAFVTVGFMGNGKVRNRLYEKLKNIGYILPAVIDVSAVVAVDAVIGEGTYVGKKSVLNSQSSVGKMCIINTATIVEHECIVGDYSHIAVAAVMCGGSSVGEGTLLGSNATVIQNIKIGDNVIVGAGTVVIENVNSGVKLVGVPGRII